MALYRFLAHSAFLRTGSLFFKFLSIVMTVGLYCIFSPQCDSAYKAIEVGML